MSARTQAVQPGPRTSWCGGDTRTCCGYDVLTNTESSLSWTMRLTSGGSGGGGSLACARMNSGTDERLSAAHAASPTAAATINATKMNARLITLMIPGDARRGCGRAGHVQSTNPDFVMKWDFISQFLEPHADSLRPS